MTEVDKIMNMVSDEDLVIVKALAKKKMVSPGYILNTAAVTYFANTMKPNLSDYQTIYLENGRKISAYSARLEQKGKKPWNDGTHGMPDHLKMIFDIFGDEEVNSNLLEYSVRLIDFTLENIFENGKGNKPIRYREALNQPNFIYMMLQIAMRLLAFDLKDRGLELENENMNYMIELLKKDKEEIRAIFIDCIEEDDKQTAIINYYKKLEKYYEDFLDKEYTKKGNELKKIGLEQGILELVSEETLFTFFGFLIENIRMKYQKQLALYNSKAITIK